jgi:hypothetical protein
LNRSAHFNTPEAILSHVGFESLSLSIGTNVIS